VQIHERIFLVVINLLIKPWKFILVVFQASSQLYFSDGGFLCSYIPYRLEKRRISGW
jgi:hypothetical protein